MSFTSDHLALALAQVTACAPAGVRRYWVGYSGGVDSHCLLHALAALRDRLGARLEAVHVNHGLSPHALDWQRHCAGVCQALGVPLTVLPVVVDGRAEAGLEAAARAARYAALRGLMEPGDCLLTAHHQDDQAETLMLQLLRGAGVRGLSAMPPCAPFGPGVHARPLLAFSRAQLHDYARRHALQWVEDESNLNLALDRNYLRHEVVPVLARRWPSAPATLARSARHCAEAQELLDELARLDLAALRDERDGTLSVAGLCALLEVRQRNALRSWLHGAGLALPDERRLLQIQRDVLPAAPDALPRVHWADVELRRYRDRLYAFPRQPLHDPAQVIPWDMRQPLDLPGAGLRLSAVAQAGQGMSAARCQAAPLTVRFRRGGERCRPVGRREHHELKKLFQEAGVPPWQRDRVPLIYLGEELAQVVGYWVCTPFQARDGEPGWQILAARKPLS